MLTAGDSQSALALLHSLGDIQLLFTDVMLPGRSGFELAQAAKALRPGLKVLYASGYTQDSMLRNGRLEPGIQLLAKPYSKADLAARIRELLD